MVCSRLSRPTAVESLAVAETNCRAKNAHRVSYSGERGSIPSVVHTDRRRGWLLQRKTSTRSWSVLDSRECICSTACARAWALGASLRGWRQRRRHVVLEPLSGRTLRFGQLHLLLHLRQGAAAGMGVDRTLPGAAGDPALPEPCRGSLRPEARHPVRYLRHRGHLRRERPTAGRSAPTRATSSRRAI